MLSKECYAPVFNLSPQNFPSSLPLSMILRLPAHEANMGITREPGMTEGNLRDLCFGLHRCIKLNKSCVLKTINGHSKATPFKGWLEARQYFSFAPGLKEMKEWMTAE